MRKKRPGVSEAERLVAGRLKTAASEQLKDLRRKFGLTQGQVADSAGISTQAYSAMETGKSLPDYPTLYSIAEQYGRDPYSLSEACGADVEDLDPILDHFRRQTLEDANPNAPSNVIFARLNRVGQHLKWGGHIGLARGDLEEARALIVRFATDSPTSPVIPYAIFRANGLRVDIDTRTGTCSDRTLHLARQMGKLAREELVDQPFLEAVAGYHEADVLAQRGDDKGSRTAIEKALSHDPPPETLLELQRVEFHTLRKSGDIGALQVKLPVAEEYLRTAVKYRHEKGCLRCGAAISYAVIEEQEKALDQIHQAHREYEEAWWYTDHLIETLNWVRLAEIASRGRRSQDRGLARTAAVRGLELTINRYPRLEEACKAVLRQCG